MTDPVFIEVGEADFYQRVLERSHEIPVVVDFWAPWCGPCRQLAPILERIAAEQPDAFLLAKLNIDESPAIAQQYGVQSIPLVVGFRAGQPHSQFLGLQAEPAVREFVAALAPSEADVAAAQAEALAGRGELEAAEVSFAAALETQPRHTRALLGLARLKAARGDHQAALGDLARIVPEPAFEAEVDRLAAQLRMQAHGSADDEELRQRVSANPDDLDARLELGRALGARGDHAGALESLLEVVRRDPGHADEAARKAMLDLFEVLGPDSELTREFRRSLAQILFR